MMGGKIEEGKGRGREGRGGEGRGKGGEGKEGRKGRGEGMAPHYLGQVYAPVVIALRYRHDH